MMTLGLAAVAGVASMLRFQTRREDMQIICADGSQVLLPPSRSRSA